MNRTRMQLGMLTVYGMNRESSRLYENQQNMKQQKKFCVIWDPMGKILTSFLLRVCRFFRLHFYMFFCHNALEYRAIYLNWVWLMNEFYERILLSFYLNLLSFEHWTNGRSFSTIYSMFINKHCVCWRCVFHSLQFCDRISMIYNRKYWKVCVRFLLCLLCDIIALYILPVLIFVWV